MKTFFLIKDDFVNSRFDRWFKRYVGNIPQSLIEKNVRKGNIRINNKKEKCSYRLQKNDQIIIQNINLTKKVKTPTKKYKPSRKELLSSSSMFLENNENFVVINKPAGIAVQSGTKSRKNILDILGNTKEFIDTSPYSVHRIDKETSGVLIVAKNRKYAQLFTSLFRIRKIHKTYLAIVLGSLTNNKGTLNDELSYYENHKKYKTNAITHFTVIDSNNNFSLLKLNPETGRKHQLRKQLLMHGHPILGDCKYKISNNYQSKKDNLMLHAHKIKFTIAGVKYNFSAEPPFVFNNFLKKKYLRIF